MVNVSDFVRLGDASVLPGRTMYCVALVAGRSSPAGDRRATGGAPNTARRIRQAGATGPSATGRRRGRSQHYRGSLECGLSTGGVLATKSERKMLASTCLYSLYAWFILVCVLKLLVTFMVKVIITYRMVSRTQSKLQ